jgi:hypothetical protein
MVAGLVPGGWYALMACLFASCYPRRVVQDDRLWGNEEREIRKYFWFEIARIAAGDGQFDRKIIRDKLEMMGGLGAFTLLWGYIVIRMDSWSRVPWPQKRCNREIQNGEPIR